MSITSRIAVAGVLALALTSPALAIKPKEAGKLQITTSSDEARQAYLKGRDLNEKLRAADARPLFQEAVAKDPNFALAHLGVANTAVTAKDFFPALDKAVALADKVSEGERLLILIAQAGTRGNPAEQKQLLDKLVKAVPGEERAHNALGLWHFGQQEWAAAAAEFQKAIKLNPEFSQPYNQLGYTLRTMEKWDESEKAFKKYIELIPGDPNPYDSLAELYMKRGKFQDSIASYEKALSVDPGFVASYIGIANNQIFMGKGEEARKTLAKLASVAKDSGQKRQSILWNAVSYIHEGATDKALAEVEKMRQLDESQNDLPNLSGAYNFTGDVLVEAGRADEAGKWYEQQLATIDKASVPPEVKEAAHRNVLYDQARIALAKGDVASAKKITDDYDKQVAAKKVRFEVQQVHELRGRIALAEKKFAPAVAELNQANQQDPRALYLLALAQQGKGDSAKARATATRIADWNALGVNYAFVRAKAKALLAS